MASAQPAESFEMRGPEGFNGSMVNMTGTYQGWPAKRMADRRRDILVILVSIVEYLMTRFR